MAPAVAWAVAAAALQCSSLTGRAQRRVRDACDVTAGEHAIGRRPPAGVGRDTPVRREVEQAGGELGVRPCSDADEHGVAGQPRAIAQLDRGDDAVATAHGGANGHAQPQVDAGAPGTLGEERADRRPERPLERDGRRLDHGDLEAERPGARGHLEPHEARSDDREASAGRERVPQGLRFVEGAQMVDAGHAVQARYPAGADAGREDELPPADRRRRR